MPCPSLLIRGEIFVDAGPALSQQIKIALERERQNSKGRRSERRKRKKKSGRDCRT
jgi:hypothetical protein